MFKWYMTENFSLKVLKIAVLIYGSLLYFKNSSGSEGSVKYTLKFHAQFPKEFHA